MKRSYPVEVLWCSNPSGGSAGERRAAGGARRTGWMFPKAVEAQLRRDTEGLSVLQLFGGRSSFGTKLDIDPFTSPHVIGDAWLPPFKQDSFDVVIIDPPYVTMSAQIKHALLCAANFIARWLAQPQGLALSKGDDYV